MRHCRRSPLLWLCALAATLGVTAVAAPAFAAFPYTRPGGNPNDFSDLYLNAGQTPSDLSGDGNDFKFAATPDPENGPQINQNPVELYGVRGAHVNDSSPAVRTAWMTTTGRPDVSIAVLDSGINWNDAGAMNDLRLKVRLSRGELPIPQHANASSCGAYDCNGDAVFNVEGLRRRPARRPW